MRGREGGVQQPAVYDARTEHRYMISFNYVGHHWDLGVKTGNSHWGGAGGAHTAKGSPFFLSTPRGKGSLPGPGERDRFCMRVVMRYIIQPVVLLSWVVIPLM